MARQDIQDSVTFITGLTIGALIGAASALLLAPQSGKRTRRDIARRAERLGDEATERLSEARAEAGRLAERTRSETRRLAKDARKKVDETSERLSEAVDQGRDRLRR